MEALPDPLDSAEQWARYHHEDLIEMSRMELVLARTRTLLHLASEMRPDPWFRERLTQIQRRLKDER
jgi:hypothetical protein